MRSITPLNNEPYCDAALVMCPGWGITQPPAGISYLKSFLQKQGMRVRCFDFSLDFYRFFPEKQYWDLNYPEHFINRGLFERNVVPYLEPFIPLWAKKILRFDPKVVGFSLFMSSVNAAILLARQIKRQDPRRIIVGGGAEAARLKNVLLGGGRPLRDVPEALLDIFDIIAAGEGEGFMAGIVSRLSRKEDIRAGAGGLWKSGEKIQAAPGPEMLANLDDVPAPDYSDFDHKYYTTPVLPLATSRGCINRCSFCADQPLWKSYRCHSAPRVVGDVETLVENYGRREIEIVDSTFNGDMPRLEEICDLLITAEQPALWSAKVTLRREMTFEVLKKMNAAGCRSLAYGVESGSARVLDEMQKNIDLREARRIIRDTHRAGIQACCFFIIGYPTETEDDFRMTLDFIEENAPYIHSFDQITGCHIEEDSFLGRNPERYGIVFKPDGWYCANSTPQIRRRRLLTLQELVKKLHGHYECGVQL